MTLEKSLFKQELEMYGFKFDCMVGEYYLYNLKSISILWDSKKQIVISLFDLSEKTLNN